MSLIKHCIVDTTTNLVVNIIDYETNITNQVPFGLESNLLAIASNIGGIGDSYIDGVIVSKPIIEITPVQGASQ